MFPKTEMASFMVSLDALLVTLIIGTNKCRDMTMPDVAEMYLHAEMDDFVIMLLTRNEVNIICKSHTEWNVFVLMRDDRTKNFTSDSTKHCMALLNNDIIFTP